MTQKRSELIQEVLENSIIMGDILPGTRLEETELATRFETSRTPVREALHKLAARGLIEILPRKGAIVPQPDPQAIIELFEVMAELEAACARLASRRLTTKDQIAIKKALDACKTTAIAKSFDKYYHKNEAFHQAIYHATHNRYLIEQCNSLLDRLRPFLRLQLQIPNRIASSLEEHEALIGAIFDGHSEKAADIARNHILIQGTGFYDFLALLKAQLKD